MALGSSNPTTNLVKIKNNTVDVGTGNASGGTQRVVLATNQPTLSVNLSGGTGNIGNININQVYSEDGASTGDESLFLSGAVRQDDISLAPTTSDNGDYTYLKTNDKGRLWTSAVIDTALPVGTNTIGKVDINTVYTEDDASVGSEKLFLTGAIRQDTLSITTSSNGDYTNLKTSNVGRLYTSTLIDSALPAGTNNIGDVDVVTLPSIPAGSNTIGNVGLVAGSNTIGNVGLVAGSAAIGTVGVTSLPALAAGTATIGKVDINQVYTEDVASTGGEALHLAGAIRQDTIAQSTTADGDYSNLKVNSIGRLYTSTTLDASLPSGTATIGKVYITDGVSDLSIKAANSPAVGADKAMVVSFAAVNSATRIGDASGNIMPAGDQPGRAIWKRLTDGTNNATIKAANSISALATDTALVVSVRDTVAVSGNLSTIATITTANLAADNVQNAASSGTTLVMTGGFASAATPTAVSGDGRPSRFWTTLSGALNIADAGGSLTVDAPVATPVFVRLSDGTNPVTTLPVSLASVPSHPVTNAGTFVTQENGAALTALQLIDDSISTVGSTALTKGVQVTGSDGTNARVISTTTAGAVNIADGGNSITVDAVVTSPVFVRLSDGTNPVATLPVSLASVPSHPVTNAGTFVTQENGAALTALQLIDDSISTIGSPVPTKGVLMTGTDGTNARALATSTTGRLIVTSDSTFAISSGNITMTTLTSPMNSNSRSSAYEASRVIKASSGNLYMLTGYSSRSSAQFIQLHNTNAVPSAGAIPEVTFYVAANSNFSLDYGVYGRSFGTGITVVCSTTGPTYTAGSADCWFDAQFK
jgi:uncharacterized lipoprotein NlpE involved in copper resistance